MTEGEHQALATLEKYLPTIKNEEIIKKLGEEVVELAMAIAKNDKGNIKEEIGDCAYILLHLLDRLCPESKGIITEIYNASQKMEIRNFKKR